MRVLGWLVVLCLLLQVTLGLRALSPSSIAGHYAKAAVCSRFFGPQKDYDRNGTAVWFNGDVCKRIPLNCTDKVIVYAFAKTGACSFRTRYLNLWRTGAFAAVVTSTFPDPGQTYAMHDGDWGKDTKHKSMVWLEVNEDKFKPIEKVLRKGSEEVQLEVLYEQNEWASIFNSWHYKLVLRGIVPAFFFCTTIYGAIVLRDVIKSENNAMRPTKILVLSIETVTMLLCGLFLAVEGMYAEDNMPFQAIWFFGTGFFGWSMFTTVAVAVFYYSLNKATSTFTLVRNTLVTHRVLLSIVFCLCIGLDLAIGCMFATYQKATLVLAAGAAVFTIGNFVVAIFFFYEKRKFHKHVVSENKKWDPKQRPPVMVQMSQHMGRWLYISAIFMLLFCIATPMIGFSFAWSVVGNYTLIPLLFMIRWGTGFTQIKALGWNPHTSGTKKKNVMRWGGDSTDTADNNSTSKSNNNSSSTGNNSNSVSFFNAKWNKLTKKQNYQQQLVPLANPSAHTKIEMVDNSAGMSTSNVSASDAALLPAR